MSSFRLLTYNIMRGGAGREAALAAVIGACAPDLVLLQEATTPAVVEKLALATGMGEWRAYKGQSLAFLSRVPVTHADWHRPRISRHAFIEVVPGTANLRVFGVHLSAVHAAWTEQRRVFELAALLRTVRARQEGLHLLVGDFNTLAPGAPFDVDTLPWRLRPLVWLSGGHVRWRTIQTVLDAGYVDTFRRLHPDDPGFTLAHHRTARAARLRVRAGALRRARRALRSGHRRRPRRVRPFSAARRDPRRLTDAAAPPRGQRVNARISVCCARHQGPDRQPRRDRRPRHPRLSRHGDRHRRGLQRMRSRGEARPARRRGVPGRPQRPARELPAHRQAHRRRAAQRRRRGASRLRVPRRERGLRARLPRRRADLHRPEPRGHRADGQQDRGPPGGDQGRRAGGARHRAAARRGRHRRRGAGHRRAHRLPADAQGRCRRRRQGHAHGGDAGRPARRAPGGALGGGLGVRRFGRLPRAPHHEAAPHRGAAARRPPRHGAALRRARVLDPAPPPESDRGEPVDGRLAGAAPRDHLGGGGGGPAGGLHQRRHDRVPARRGRPVLFPRDEHPPAGRAPGHRDGERPRPRALADPHRPRRGARPRSRGAADAAWPRGGVPHLRRGSGQQLPAVAGPRARPEGAARPRRARRQRRHRGPRRADLLRPDDLEADHLGRGPGRRRSRA